MSHCGKEQSYDNVPLNPKVVNQISCKYCNQLQRIPVRFRSESSNVAEKLSDKLKTLLPSSSNVIPVSKLSKIFALCQEIIKIDTGRDHVWLIMLQILDAMKNDQGVINLLRKAIIANPYNPHFFDQMSARLAKMGRDDELVKYKRQADLLRSVGVTKPTDINVIIDRGYRFVTVGNVSL